MKKTFLLFVVVLMFVLAVPVAAKWYVPVGERMRINNWGEGWCEFLPEGPPYSTGVSEWPASSAFYISHGWTIESLKLDYWEDPSIYAQAHKRSFQVYVDGELQKPTGRYRMDIPEYEIQFWVDIYEFKDGMTGVHEIQGRWVSPVCVWDNIPVRDCPDVNEHMSVIVCTVEVTFTE